MKRILLALAVVASVVALSIAVAPAASSSAPTYNTVITSPVVPFGPPACATEARGILDGMTGRADNPPSTDPVMLPNCFAINIECYFDCMEDAHAGYDEAMEDAEADRGEAIEDAHFAAEIKYAIGLAMHSSGDETAGCAAMNGAASGAEETADAADATYTATERAAAIDFAAAATACCYCTP